MISDGKRSDTLFVWRKIRRVVKEKNKTIYPRLAFPFCLKTAKSKATFRKSRTALSLFWNDYIFVKIFSRMFINHSLSHFYHLLTSRCKWMPTSIVRNLGIGKN